MARLLKPLVLSFLARIIKKRRTGAKKAGEAKNSTTSQTEEVGGWKEVGAQGGLQGVRSNPSSGER